MHNYVILSVIIKNETQRKDWKSKIVEDGIKISSTMSSLIQLEGSDLVSGNVLLVHMKRRKEGNVEKCGN